MRTLILLLVAVPVYGQDLIAKPEALTPEQERKAFKLPPGFEAQLVASEPRIQKPMQMAFDSRGRLWVTTSHHYPFAAEKGKGADKLYVLSDFDANGLAKTVEVFDDKLNIPIGVLPLPDGKSVIVGEAGRIVKLTGTAKAEKREVLFDGFGTRDTHGMTNSYTLLPDGWVYACHGYLNDSRVKGKDGHEIHLVSGNTFRFKPDGSRIEIFTHGQVNPFGIAVDPWLNLYTADCHTKPMTQLIRGATYDSFGKPHGGLGYAPHMFHHQHGSTALCGLVYYSADHFPKEWQNVMFLGNVVTGRINCDRITWHGSTPGGTEMPDFLVSSDPWFRPVDLKLGPDGALYVSDFYNRIIGHYEVDLKHPQRDKDRGRIWRIVWKGSPAMPRKNWAQLPEVDLLRDFGHPNTTVRLLAANEAASRGKFAPDGARITDQPETLTVRAGFYAFAQERSDEIDLEGYRNAIRGAKDSPEIIKPEHQSGLVVKALTSRREWSDGEREIALDCLRSFDSVRVKRAVIDGMIAHPHAAFVEPLLDFLPKIAAEDTHMRHAARVALKDCILAAGGADKVIGLATGDRAATLADVLVAIRTPEASAFLAKTIGHAKLDAGQRSAAAEVIGQFHPDLAMKVLEGSEPTHDLVQSLLRGMQAGNVKKLPDALPPIADKLVAATLKGKSPNLKTVAATLKLATAFPESTAAFAELPGTRLALDRLLNPRTTVNIRADFADALYRIPSEAIRAKLRVLLADANEPLFLRSRLIVAFLEKPTAADRDLARQLLKTVPYSLALNIAVGLAGDAAGAESLLTAVKAGEAPARLLREATVLARLKAANVPNAEARVLELTKNLPSETERLDELVKTRTVGFKRAKPDIAKGKVIFANNCAICHKLENEGTKIGPELDGIGVRGLERVIEDTLDPSRNVDQAFRATKLDLKDGRSLTGLLLREEGTAYILADALGKETRIAKAEVDDKTTLLSSAMPANIDTSIPEADYYHLLAFLLEQKQKK